MFYPIDFKNYNKGTEIKSNKSDNRLKNIFFLFTYYHDITREIYESNYY